MFASVGKFPSQGRAAAEVLAELESLEVDDKDLYEVVDEFLSDLRGALDVVTGTSAADRSTNYAVLE